MENSPQVSGGTPFARGPLPRGSQLPDHWRMARAAHVDLLLMGMPRVNLLLIAPDGVVRFVLESLLLDLHEPIARWRLGQKLALPPTDEGGTLVLHESARSHSTNSSGCSTGSSAPRAARRSSARRRRRSSRVSTPAGSSTRSTTA